MKGGENLTDSKKLSDEITDSGMTITAIAKKIGITREGFYKKLNNETEFKASEISALQKILRLSNKKRDEIFFCKRSWTKINIIRRESEKKDMRKPFPFNNGKDDYSRALNRVTLISIISLVVAIVALILRLIS